MPFLRKPDPIITRRPEGPFTDIEYSSTSVSTVLAALLRSAYADLSTALTIVHFDGTHLIPPQYRSS